MRALAVRQVGMSDPAVAVLHSDLRHLLDHLLDAHAR